MKIFAVALVASVLIAVSLAAPTKDDAFPLNEWEKNLTVAHLTCIRQAVRKVLVGSEANQNWEATWDLLSVLVRNYTECAENTNDRCGRTLATQSAYAIRRFYQNLLAGDHSNLLRKIRRQIAKDCYSTTSAEAFVELVDSLIASRNAETAKRYQCVIDVIDGVWTENNLGPEWNQTKEVIQPHMENLGNCTEQQCTLEESLAVSGVLYAFLIQVKNDRPEIYAEIMKRVKENCSAEEERDDDAAARFQCQINIINAVADKHSLGPKWAKTRAQIRRKLFELQQCSNSRCSLSASAAIARILFTYLSQVPYDHPDAWAEMAQQIYQNCYHKSEATETERIQNDETPLNGTADYIALLECTIVVGQNITAEYNLTTIWEAFQPTLLVHLDSLRNCSLAGNSSAIQACNETESQAAEKTYTQFLRRVEEQSTEAAEKIQQIINVVCLSIEASPPIIPTEEPDTFDGFEFESNDEIPSNETVDYVGILECAIRAGENVTEEFNLVEIWESFEPKLLVHLEKVRNCLLAGDENAVQACNERESQATITTYVQFLNLVEEQSKEAAAKIREIYNTVCLSDEVTPPIDPTDELLIAETFDEAADF